jgi:hypothetical protein
MDEYPLGSLGGLRLSASPSAVVGLLVLLVVLTGVGLLLLDLAWGQAILFGLLGTLLHFLSELIHQFGHAWAARRTGYPMTGVRFWTIFGASLYPADEPALPAAVHIRRALGGPPVSLLVALLLLPAVLALRSSGGLVWWLVLLLFLENLLIFGLGAFLPLGFNDGSTLLYWWGKR